MLHVDMDAFFASVEVRRRPQLRGTPVVVGGTGPRGVVSSASYEARRRGVRSAMPTALARRMCPDAIFLPPDMAAYADASRSVMRLFHDITPLVEPLSVDEAFLDVSGATHLFGSPTRIAEHIRTRVRAELDLTCSVGVAPTMFLAKLASTRAKPDGLRVVAVAGIQDFLRPLPVSALWGVGESTARRLHQVGLRRVGDIADAPDSLLRQAVGRASATKLRDLALGIDPRKVTTSRAEKSISAETTFDTDVADPQTIRRTMLALANKVGARLRGHGYAGRTIAIKVRLADFRTLNRSHTDPLATDVARDIFDIAWSLFQALDNGQRVRLVGVRVEGLIDAAETPRQMLLGEREHSWRDAERAADAAVARFGSAAVTPASLLGRDAPRAYMTDNSPT